MFFDIILLNSQHGGRFGIAWLMATRGLRFVTKKQLKELNLLKLCDDLKLFIISYSVSPKKRFSLRLSAILINGMVKIFKEQAKILHEEVFSLISTIHIPSGIGYVIDSMHTGIFETPPTPVAKTKKKRRRGVIKETPEEILQSKIDEMFIQLPDIEDVLRPTTRTDEISIREEMPKRAELTEDDFGLGVLSRKEVEEEMQLLLAKPREIPKDRSQYPSSSDSLPAPPQLIEVVAQIHAPRDDLSVPEHLQSKTDEQVPVTEHISVPVFEMGQTTEPILTTESVPLVEPFPAPETTLEKGPHALTELPAVAQTSHVSLVEIEPIVPVQETSEMAKVGKMRREQRKQFAELQANEIARRTAQVTQKKEKLLFGLFRSKFVHINRCSENNGKLINESCQLPVISYTNALNESFYNMLWTEEEESENIQVRAAALSKSLSLRESVNIHRTDTISAQGSTLESVSETGITFSVQALQSLEQEPVLRESGRRTDDAVRQISIEEPIEPVFTPGKRKRLTMTDEELPKRHKDSVQFVPSVPLVEKTVEVSKEQVSVAEPIAGLGQEIESFTPHQIVLEPIPHTRKTMVSPSPSDYKLRQQNIINIIAKWPLSQGMIMIEDICEKPINRLNIARAFSDLLILAANRFLILTSDENTIELKSIEKGPKLMN